MGNDLSRVRLGHAMLSITLDLYSHVIPSMQREAASGLGDELAAGHLPAVLKTSPWPWRRLASG
jgi:hypothetical protein